MSDKIVNEEVPICKFCGISEGELLPLTRRLYHDREHAHGSCIDEYMNHLTQVPPPTAQVIDEEASLLRTFSQASGLSNSEPWTHISERRKDQWRRFAQAMRESGYSIVKTRVPYKIASPPSPTVRISGKPGEWQVAVDTRHLFVLRQFLRGKVPTKTAKEIHDAINELDRVLGGSTPTDS